MRVTFQSADFDARVAEQIGRALESNHIVYFPRSPVPLPGAQALQHLRVDLPPHLAANNVSYYPRGRRLLGLKANRSTRTLTTQVLREHLQEVTAFLQKLMPRQCAGWTLGKVSFRPLQERGRNLRPRDSNELVHIDAGIHGATDGDRILRFFVNIHEHEDRVWATQGSFGDLLDQYGIECGLLDRTGRLRVRLDRRAPDHARRLAVGALALVHPLARKMDSSPYDRAMLQLHRYMKNSERFKAERRDYEELRFAPGSAWMVFTDGVSHASVSGQFALVSTFILRRRSLCHAHHAPYNLMEAHS
jgi:hypothetical protein